MLASRLVAQWLQIVKSPATVSHHPTIDTSHLVLEPHHSLQGEMLPQTAQMQMLEESREDDGHFNFHFPNDPNMQLDIPSDLYCDPTDITFDTISKDDLLPASGNLSDYRTDNCNSTMISNGSDLGEIHTEFPSDLVSVNEVKSDPVLEMNFESVVEPTVISEVTPAPVPVNEVTELMDTDSAIVTNGEPQEKLVLKLSVQNKDGKKIIVKSPTKRKLSEDEEDASPAKRKARELSKDKKREKEKSDKSSHKHDKTDKKSLSSSLERRSSKDTSRDSHKSESRHSDSKSKHHSDKSKDRSRDKDRSKSSSSSSSSSSSKDKEKERERARLKEKERKQKEKEKAETQAEKDKATLAKIMQPSVSKLGKIPKKTDSSSKSGDKVHPPVLADTKKVSISIENRKQSGEPRPKTVKTPPTKFRSTGLEDVVKPPPSRKDIKKPATSAGAPLPAAKESNPLLNVPVLPERRTKPVLNMAGPPERPGAIKLIPAKPKCEYFQSKRIKFRGEIIYLIVFFCFSSIISNIFFLKWVLKFTTCNVLFALLIYSLYFKLICFSSSGLPAHVQSPPPSIVVPELSCFVNIMTNHFNYFKQQLLGQLSSSYVQHTSRSLVNVALVGPH